jgi:hypothetical protein
MSSTRRWAAAMLLAGAILAVGSAASAGTALAATAEDTDAEAFVVLTGRLDVTDGTTYRAAVIFDGPLVVQGHVTGDAIAFNGDVIVFGEVDRNVTALNGRVVVQRGGSVGGNVVSSEPPSVAEGTVAGSVRQGAEFDVRWPALFGRVLWWFVTTGSVFVLGLLLTLLFPRAADALGRAALHHVGPSIGWGAAGFIGLPLLGVIAAVTVVAGLAGVGLLLALLLIYTVAYTVGAFALGRLLVKEPRGRFLAFLAGFGILRVVALVPILGGLAFVVAAGWGIGAIVVASYRAGRGTTGAASLPGGASLPPVPPMPSLP